MHNVRRTLCYTDSTHKSNDLIQPQLESDGLDSKQPLGINIQEAAGLPSLQKDLAVMCIMSEGLDVIQILHQLESEGLDPRLNQVKSDRLAFKRDIQMDLNCHPDGL